jgi:hypothetical protein
MNKLLFRILNEQLWLWILLPYPYEAKCGKKTSLSWLIDSLESKTTLEQFFLLVRSLDPLLKKDGKNWGKKEQRRRKNGKEA